MPEFSTDGPQKLKSAVRTLLNQRGIIFIVVAVRPKSTQVGDSDSLCAEPLLVSAAAASSMCGKSLRTWRAWDSAGLIPRPIRIGRSTLWRTEELKGWVAAGCPRRAEWESYS